MIRKQLLPGKWHYIILYLKSEFQLIHQNWTYQLLMTLSCPQDWWPACNYHLGYINSGAKSALEKRVVNFHTNARIFFREIRTKLFTSYTRNLLQKAKLIDNHTLMIHSKDTVVTLEDLCPRQLPTQFTT